MTVTLNDGTKQKLTATIGNLQPFVGFISSKPLTSLVLTFPTTGNYATINNLVVVAAVPEPGVATIFVAISIAGVYLLLARRRSKCQIR